MSITSPFLSVILSPLTSYFAKNPDADNTSLTGGSSSSFDIAFVFNVKYSNLAVSYNSSFA